MRKVGPCEIFVSEMQTSVSGLVFVLKESNRVLKYLVSVFKKVSPLPFVVKSGPSLFSQGPFSSSLGAFSYSQGPFSYRPIPFVFSQAFFHPGQAF